jgi:hypothetical protein
MRIRIRSKLCTWQEGFSPEVSQNTLASLWFIYRDEEKVCISGNCCRVFLRVWRVYDDESVTVHRYIIMVACLESIGVSINITSSRGEVHSRLRCVYMFVFVYNL